MNVALIISGYLRSFELNIENIKSKIIDNFYNVDIYIHITKNEESDDKYLNTNNNILNTLINDLNPLILHEQNYLIDNDKKSNDIKNSWLKLYKLNSLKSINELNSKYDLVIKYRPDLNIISENIFSDIKSDIIYIPKDSKIDIDKLKNRDDNYLCDIFAYGSSEMMNKYFKFYESLDLLIEKYGNVSETLLYHYLNDNNIKYELVDIDYNVILSKCNIFSIVGDSGSGKSTLSKVLKKYFSNSFLLECDRYHKWERNDENWKNYTHLNPEANLITKMSSDIFDLKIGKEIYHVDYDHSTGKFTDKQTIEPTDNIIVCGLHSLYTDTNNLYDLKIFIDTDDNLKLKWKINRDVKERGYTVEKCIEQINSRKEDYEKFIKPQREKSDLVINFFTDDNNLSNSDDSSYEKYLRVFISNKYDIHKIINKLGFNHIKYDSYINDDTFELVFREYVDFDFGDLPKENNYYDYIMLIIQNIIQ